MPRYEYKVVPAPAKGQKARGVKTPQDRFAHSIETILNTLAAEGWEYLRSDMLPSEERTGLTGSTTNWRNVLVFRRVLGGKSRSTSQMAAPPRYRKADFRRWAAAAVAFPRAHLPAPLARPLPLQQARHRRCSSGRRSRQGISPQSRSRNRSARLRSNRNRLRPSRNRPSPPPNPPRKIGQSRASRR